MYNDIASKIVKNLPPKKTKTYTEPLPVRVEPELKEKYLKLKKVTDPQEVMRLLLRAFLEEMELAGKI